MTLSCCNFMEITCNRFSDRSYTIIHYNWCSVLWGFSKYFFLWCHQNDATVTRWLISWFPLSKMYKYCVKWSKICTKNTVYKKIYVIWLLWIWLCVKLSIYHCCEFKCLFTSFKYHSAAKQSYKWKWKTCSMLVDARQKRRIWKQAGTQSYTPHLLLRDSDTIQCGSWFATEICDCKQADVWELYSNKNLETCGHAKREHRFSK